MRFQKLQVGSILLVIAIAVTLAYAGQGSAPARPSQSPQVSQGTGNQQAQTPAGPTAAAKYKNIKILTDVPADQLIPSMQFIAGSLGVQCDFCHVMAPQRDFASDEKDNKKTARQMMQMTHNINQANFDGRPQVTCATCHSGHQEPVAYPPVMDEARMQERLEAAARRPQPTPGAAPPGQPNAQNAAGAQTAEQRPNPAAMQAAADEIFAKYLQAIGGEQAVDKLTTKIAKGTLTTAQGQRLQFETEQKAPDKLLIVTTMPNNSLQRIGYNGTEGWSAEGDHAHAVEGFELAAMKVNTGFYRDMKLKPEYARAIALAAKQKINGRDTNVVRAVLPGNQVHETLYFEADSALLVRRLTLMRTALGQIPEQVDYSDYHEVDGVKIPFTVRRSQPNAIVSRTYTDVKFNAPVDDAKFAAQKMPAPSGGQ